MPFFIAHIPYEIPSPIFLQLNYAVSCGYRIPNPSFIIVVILRKPTIHRLFKGQWPKVLRPYTSSHLLFPTVSELSSRTPYGRYRSIKRADRGWLWMIQERLEPGLEIPACYRSKARGENWKLLEIRGWIPAGEVY